jgi:GntR family transcriptional regulator
MTGAQVLADITERIKTGEYPPNTKLPSASQLADLYGVSPSTVQRVLALLQERGVVVGQQGRGVYVLGKD